MDRASVRAFVQRDRASVEALKQAHLTRRFRELGPLAGLRAGQALWQYARRARPDWPTALDRSRDLAHHIALKRRLGQAADAFARR